MKLTVTATANTNNARIVLYICEMNEFIVLVVSYVVPYVVSCIITTVTYPLLPKPCLLPTIGPGLQPPHAPNCNLIT